MLDDDILQLQKLFSPQALWEIRPKKMRGQVTKKLSESTGFIKPDVEFFYPDGQSIDGLYSNELLDFQISDYVIFSLRDAPDNRKREKEQPYLQQAYDVEFDDPNSVLEYDSVSPQKILKLAERLEQILRDADGEINRRMQASLVEKRKELNENIQAINAKRDSLDKEDKKLQEKDSALNRRANELDQKELSIDAQIQQAIASRIEEIEAERKKVDEWTGNLAKREQGLTEREQLLARNMQMFKEKGGEEFVKLFAGLVVSDSDLQISPATNQPVPNNFHSAVSQFLGQHGLIFDDAISTQFLLCALSAQVSGQFVVLSGPTGVGKTSIVNAFSSALGAGHGVVPVRPAWIDPTDLLGFFNPQQNRYQPSSFMDYFLEAGQYSDANRMYFLTLDEMNLSRVENYAADFLSRLEKARAGEDANLALYSKDIEAQLKIEVTKAIETGNGHSVTLATNLKKYPANVKIPEGLVMFGTINLDETTHHLSPKFLDRSFLINIPARDLVDDISSWRNGNAKVPTFFDLSLSVARELSKSQGRLSKESLEIWDDILSWQDNFLQPLGIRLGFRFPHLYVTFMHIAQNLNIDSYVAASVFIKSKLFPWISFHKEDMAIEREDLKIEVLEEWSDDDSLDKYPEEYGVRAALQRIVERSENSVIVQYLE